MIKKLDYLFSKANLFWVFAFVFNFMFIFLYILGLIFHGEWKHGSELLLLMSSVIAVLTTSMTFVLRSLNTFYRKADAIEEKAKVAETISELQAIYANELKPLYKDAGFQQQGDRLRQIHQYMEGKHDILLRLKDKE